MDKKVDGLSLMIAEIAASVNRLVVESDEYKKREVQSVLTGSFSQNGSSKLMGKENVEFDKSEMDSLSAFCGDGTDRLKFKRIEMPVFCGEKSNAWVYKAVTYFDVHRLTELEKVEISICSFDPNTVDWFRYAHKRKAILSWQEMKQRIFDRFQPSQEGNLMSRFLSIKQETTVAEYRKRCEIFSAPVPGLVEEVLENTFLNRLCATVKAEVISR